LLLATENNGVQTNAVGAVGAVAEDETAIQYDP